MRNWLDLPRWMQFAAPEVRVDADEPTFKVEVWFKNGGSTTARFSAPTKKAAGEKAKKHFENLGKDVDDVQARSDAQDTPEQNAATQKYKSNGPGRAIADADSAEKWNSKSTDEKRRIVRSALGPDKEVKSKAETTAYKKWRDLSEQEQRLIGRELSQGRAIADADSFSGYRHSNGPGWKIVEGIGKNGGEWLVFGSGVATRRFRSLEEAKEHVAMETEED